MQVHDAVTGTPTTFPDRLSYILGGQSVRAFARHAGVSDTFLRQCLSGKTEPTRTKLLALATTGGVSVEWLATGNTPAESSAGGKSTETQASMDTLETVANTVETVIQAITPDLDAARRAHLIRTVFDDVVRGHHDNPHCQAHVHTLLQQYTRDRHPATMDSPSPNGLKQDLCQ
ncbi:MAG: hypothetical protein FKY71_19815 [Spiribacter salinus]|uniref:HTH cro/C1-type domain-containing protein n=1 Tax=Spiribacter salinus TaxID=1335746 RepID=A0A540V716_9GAMM|nr:MAG: hypothetical protein FKY71_19815 [Spiribacter salinus]